MSFSRLKFVWWCFWNIATHTVIQAADVECLSCARDGVRDGFHAHTVCSAFICERGEKSFIETKRDWLNIRRVVKQSSNEARSIRISIYRVINTWKIFVQRLTWVSTLTSMCRVAGVWRHLIKPHSLIDSHRWATRFTKWSSRKTQKSGSITTWIFAHNAMLN